MARFRIRTSAPAASLRHASLRTRPSACRAGLDFAPRFGVVLRSVRQRQDGAEGDASTSTWRARRSATRSATTRCGSSRTTGPGATPSDATLDNGDNVAQENEIGPSNNLAFGLPVLSLQPDPDGLAREDDLETSIAIQHELFRGLSVSGSWFRRSTHNERRTDNQLVSNANYFPVDVVSPLDGQVFTVYNLDPSKRGQYNALDYNSTDSDKRSRVYNGYELGVSGRLHGASFFGGWGFEQLVSVQCDSVDNPNYYLGGALNPTAQVGGTAYLGWCDQSKLGHPVSTWRQAVRLVHDSVATSRSTPRCRATMGPSAAPTGTSGRQRPTRRTASAPANRVSSSFPIS